MAFRNIYIENDVRLNIKNEQLVVTKEEISHTFPLEDINSICMESQRTNITTYALRKFIEHDIIVYVCDERHLPTGILVGMNNYSRQLKNIKLQMNVSKPVNKRIWQDIIKMKVHNQAKCLEYSDSNGSQYLDGMVSKIVSGDTGNIEARAAVFYFRNLFGRTFNRKVDCKENAALNYGYSIIRGIIARTLIMYGFEPALGIFHHNELNNFNLADDFIEPFRPLVDLYVISNIDFSNKELSSKEKRKIYNVVNQLVLIDGKRFNVSGAIEYMIKTYSTSINKDENLIKVPELIMLEEYRYA